MDYNKEEAGRAREAAMNKFLAKDYAGARKFAMKAQSMNPEIEGITQMVATFAMHLAAQHIINGEIDYYGVLGVNPESDDETVRKRYKKLDAMLHPDRNKSIGAEEAFKFVSQAWGVLSDKAKRAEYDSKRKVGVANNGVEKADKDSVNSTAKGKTSKRRVKRASDASASSSSAAFWTVCSNCRTQYEYHRVYLNQNLLCPNCRKPFIAVETDPPHPGSIRKTFFEDPFDSIRHLTEGRDNNDVDWAAATRRAAATTPSTNPPKRIKVVENAVAGSNVTSSSAPPKSNSAREISDVELRNVLVMKKSKPTIVTKLEDLITQDVNMVSAGSSLNKSGCVEDTASGTDKDMTIKVTDSDLCDFNKNRTEKSFSDDQIWACYDSLERMPRVYFMVDKVLTVDPFKACITQLDTSETSRACGGFRAGVTQICHSPYIFSHKVEVIKGNNQGEFLIYPRTGDVWALYKTCNYLAGGKAVEYDVVEVVEGYTEEFGVTVVPLMKVAGFKSVFRHYMDQIRSISKDELSIFSHQIPSYLITGKEAVCGLRGCRQLDPAATPSQLLQVIDG